MKTKICILLLPILFVVCCKTNKKISDNTKDSVMLENKLDAFFKQCKCADLVVLKARMVEYLEYPEDKINNSYIAYSLFEKYFDDLERGIISLPKTCSQDKFLLAKLLNHDLKVNKNLFNTIDLIILLLKTNNQSEVFELILDVSRFNLTIYDILPNGKLEDYDWPFSKGYAIIETDAIPRMSNAEEIGYTEDFKIDNIYNTCQPATSQGLEFEKCLYDVYIKKIREDWISGKIKLKQ